MRRALTRTVAALCATWMTTVSAQSLWVPVVAHVPGLDGSVWRTDVAILNPCLHDAVVTLRLHTSDGEVEKTYKVAAGRQQIFEDVVAELISGELSAALEVEADEVVTVTSRTYNLTEQGRFGQGLPGVRPEDGFAAGESVILQQLRQDESFRSNLAVLNMGAEDARVEIALFDRLGAPVGSHVLNLGAGTTTMDSRPFARRYDRHDIIGGYARVTVRSGSGVYPFASVVDGSRGDPTTILPIAEPWCPADIALRLEAVDGLTVVEGFSSLPGYRYFELYYWQPADHGDPHGPGFSQYMTLLHRTDNVPLVFHTAGYHNQVHDFALELTAMLGANQLSVEHRFFADSTPLPVQWDLLTIDQAAADHHRIVEALKPVLGGLWLGTGASKGGMAAVYHRRFYPDDVYATVAYVAPISLAAPDQRYVDFVATRGDDQCRADLETLQREILLRRESILEMLDDWMVLHGDTYQRIGGSERAFESAVALLPFTFWVYAGRSYCGAIPGSEASDAVLFNTLATYSSITYPTDAFLNEFAPYFYQAHTELGFPDIDFGHLDDLLVTDPVNLEEGLLPEGVSADYDGGEAMRDVARWVATEGRRLLLIYGENDAWTAGAFELGDAADSHIFTVADGTHRASISRLSADDRQLVEEILARWTGITPKKAVEAYGPPSRFDWPSPTHRETDQLFR